MHGWIRSIALVVAICASACAAGPNIKPSSAQSMEDGLATEYSHKVTEDGLVQVSFNASLADFPNPERGFYRPIHSGDLADLTQTQVAAAFDDGFRLMYARIDLEPYRDREIPSRHLDRLRAAFEMAREGGVKLIVRAVYNYPTSETDYLNAQDASFPRVLSHITQLAPLFQENADIIAYMQAGFVGAWGEWHTSSNGLTQRKKRTRIKDALLDAVPSSRFVQFRYPPHMIEWQEDLPDVSAALDGGFRIGFHNDCFLASQTDVGTFAESPALQSRQRRYIKQLGELGVFGGETCNPADDDDAIPRTACADILTEGAQYHITYLNTSYYRKLFHKKWIKKGCMPQIRRSMGYRFSLTDTAHKVSATPGEAFELSFEITNSGWARLYNPRPVSIILREQSSGTVRRLMTEGSDPRTWLPGTETTETVSTTMPNDLATGTWNVLFSLPDAEKSIRDDTRYAIRIANDDQIQKGQYWDESLGAFALGTSINVLPKQK